MNAFNFSLYLGRNVEPISAKHSHLSLSRATLRVLHFILKGSGVPRLPCVNKLPKESGHLYACPKDVKVRNCLGIFPLRYSYNNGTCLTKSVTKVSGDALTSHNDIQLTR